MSFLQDYLRGASSSAPLPPPPPLTSLPPLSSLSPPLLSSLSSHLISSPSLPSSSLSFLLSSASSLLSLPPPPPPFPSHLSLLLGSISLHSSSAYPLLISLFQKHLSLIASAPSFLPEALAGLGYALLRVPPRSHYFSQIVSFLFTVWRDSGIASLENGVMVFKLVDWLVSSFIGSGYVEKVSAFCYEITNLEKCGEKRYAEFAVVMACCGTLRALKVGSSRYKFELNPEMKESVEIAIGVFAEKAILGYEKDDVSLLIKCIALGLARCGQIGFNPNIVKSLCIALTNEVFPLKSLIQSSLQNSNGDALTKLKEHMEGMLFKEAGAVTGVLCNQYSVSDDPTKEFVESLMWDYSHELYSSLRSAILVHKGKSNNLLLSELERIAEAAFLMVVVIANEVSKSRLNPRPGVGDKPPVSVRMLVAFSCVEYLRRVRLPEYTDAVRRAVLTIQDDVALSSDFLDSMPSYYELTGKLDCEDMVEDLYHWSKDDVQTARVLFYLRVIPTFVSLIPSSLFAMKVASTMFLYMQYPNEKVARASHSVLVSFMSSSNQKDDEERLSLKEQLAFYYVQRAVEAYPGVTPFEGLASGVVALVRNLPAGSPGTFYCTYSLISKAKSLSDEATARSPNMWKFWEESSEPCKKVVDLLLRLLSLVDIQVLPYLLREVAGLVSQLPKDGQDALLGEMYVYVAESDDVTRKPVLVSWLQSLSYLSSQTVSNPVAISCL
ncbi:obscurin-like protein [Rhynchospora pubera]|uniref:Obscurin-like protein n=1 Tax=Rhynchospora pubera TaxID=906938 RepID=A0AAV8GL54_9POAL|nr:obscurin-like protein [Rhynchospora pubera]